MAVRTNAGLRGAVMSTSNKTKISNIYFNINYLEYTGPAPSQSFLCRLLTLGQQSNGERKPTGSLYLWDIQVDLDCDPWLVTLVSFRDGWSMGRVSITDMASQK